ncbi:MAG: acyl-ACP--UDP-N-acetylglucosamine O-acyltransferase [Chlamydiota bacterium]|nr:acyl-ACP--UDP-N-acetylglucosamine O-acyltransferase [Chlamydiota bacterium]
MSVHSTAIINGSVKLDPSVSVGPYAVIEGDVEIGANTTIGPHAVITGYTKIGQNNEIGAGVVLGQLPQDKKYEPGCRSYLVIGHDNVFREYVTVHRGTETETMTVIGNHNYFMVSSHVAHNCVVGNGVVFCNGAIAAGHCHIHDQAFISGYVLLHQFVHVGRLAMFSGAARVSMDVPPFMMACERNEIWSINFVGLERAGIEKEQIQQIKKMYRIFYRSGLNVKSALEKIEETGFSSPLIHEFVDFVKQSPNGVLPHRKKT